MREELARLLDGLTGTVRFGPADPRWDSLLGCGSRVLGLSLSDGKMQDFCDALLRNNPDTGNFGSLVALTMATVDEAVSTAFAVAEASEAADTAATVPVTAVAAAARHGPEGFPRALAALRLTRLFAARMVSTLDASQLRAQLYSRGNKRRTGSGVVENGGGGGGGGAITEGQDEAAATQQSVGEREPAALADPVTALLASIVALLCASEQGAGGGTGSRRGAARGGGGGGGTGVLSVEGFSDLQLEGVGLLLVLLGTQAYGPPPSLSSPSWNTSTSPPGTNGAHRTAGATSTADNVFLDALMRETSNGIGRSRRWGACLPRAVLGWFIRRPAAPPGSAASALANALRAPPPSRRSSTSSRRPSADGSIIDARHGRSASSAAAPSPPDPSPASSSSALVLPTTTADAAGNGPNMTTEARRLLAAYPGALVLLVARALLYVVTLRGLIGVLGGAAGAGVGGNLLTDGIEEDNVGEEVTEAPGGAPKEPGEWEGYGVPAADGVERKGGGKGAASGRGGVAGSSRHPRKVSPLADRGVLLLLILLRNRAKTNPFRAAVASCVDAELDDNGGDGGGDGGRGSGSTAAPMLSSPSAATPMRVSFRGLFEAFAATLEAPSSASRVGWGPDVAGQVESVGREGVALLLYSLLQANPGFLRAAVVRSDADALLLPLLRTLHDCVSAEQQQQLLQNRRWTKKVATSGADPSPPVLYVPAIVVLLFTQDAAFNRQSFRQVVQGDVAWGTARNLRGASLGSLIVLSTLRCLGHNLKRLKDGYLLENCLAILVNLAAQSEHLEPYAAERLVSVLVAASHRWIQGATAAAKTAQAAHAAAATKGNGGVAGNGEGENSGGGAAAAALAAGMVDEGVGGEAGGGLSDVQELCGEVARVLFLFVWTCTRPRRLGSNVELLYALLHEQTSLDAICTHPALAATGWAGDLPRLLAHFQSLARQREEDGGGTGLTVKSAMETIEKGVRHYTTEAMGMGQDGGGDAAEDGRGSGGAARGAGREEDDGAEGITLLYEEGEHSEAFFLPYLWKVLLSRTPDLNWSPDRVRVFSTSSSSPPHPSSSTTTVTTSPPSQPPGEVGRGGGGGGGGGDNTGAAATTAVSVGDLEARWQMLVVRGMHPGPAAQLLF
eukprot:g15028.t1